MRDRLFYPLAILAAVGLVALAMNWPEGDALAPGAPPAQPSPPETLKPATQSVPPPSAPAA